MSDRSKIEWTDATWNPVRGCTKISPGCKHCYAATFAERWRGIPNHPYEHGFDLRLVPDKLVDPLLYAHSRTIFVNSMSDLFHARVPDTYIASVFAVMHTADWHVYQVLTKRADRMRDVLTAARHAPPGKHIWLGVSVENKKHGLPRIELLRDTPAAVRFLSIEPLLEGLGELDLDGIDWVIVGGESGPGARPMHPEWVTSIQRQCLDADVPFFFKQWGGVQKGKHGRVLDGRTWDGLPPRPQLPVPTIEERKRRRSILEKEIVHVHGAET
ncbi:MAG: phage Gp37/Gp68 family protein [Planctomycetes bacterium]|jgi:protein gp37|nr:phage Gp37/Gp68 family protein [Planctomycetota bacterium]